MKRRVQTILVSIILLVIAVWIIDKIPFTKAIEQEISANVYENGVVTGQITIVMDGDKSNYLFRRADAFEGFFSIPCVERTGDKDLQTIIRWSGERGETARHISYFKTGETYLAEDFNIVPYLLINDKMTKFAIMLTDGTIIATSDELQARYTEHITWDADTASTRIVRANQIPEID